MKIVYLGDIVAKSGRDAVKRAIPELKEKYKYDALIINVDNAAHGFGCSAKICSQFLNCGVSGIMCGDHVWNQKDLQDFLNENKRIVRPLNYPEMLPGKGYAEIPLDNGQKLLIAEVVGQVFMKEVEPPVFAVTRLLEQYQLKKNIDAILIDVHAEATAEKQALAFFMDGKVSGVIGTHTHVPTDDETILPKGTAYQTDTGMCGDYVSVIGFNVQAPIDRLSDRNSAKKLDPASNTGTVRGIFIETDDKTGLAVKVEKIKIIQ